MCRIWFTQRENALTSHGSENSYRSVAPFIDVEHPLREDFERVFGYAGLLRLLPGAGGEGYQDEENLVIPAWFRRELANRRRARRRAGRQGRRRAK